MTDASISAASDDNSLFFIDSVGDRYQQPNPVAHEEPTPASTAESTTTALDTPAQAAGKGTQHKSETESVSVPANTIDVIDICMDDLPPLERPHSSGPTDRYQFNAPLPMPTYTPTAPATPPTHITHQTQTQSQSPHSSSSYHPSGRPALTGNALALTHLADRGKPTFVPLAPFLTLTSAAIAASLKINPYQPPTKTNNGAPNTATNTPMSNSAAHTHNHAKSQLPTPPATQPNAKLTQQTHIAIPTATSANAAAAVTHATQPTPGATAAAAAPSSVIASAIVSAPAKPRLALSHLPTAYRQMVELTPPSVDNPLGLVPLIGSVPPSVTADFAETGLPRISDDLLTEVFSRWIKCAYEVKGTNEFAFGALMMQFTRDTNGWLDGLEPRLDSARIQDCFCRAWNHALPKIPGPTVQMQLNSRGALTCRRRPHISAVGLTHRFATPKEYHAHLLQVSSKKLRKQMRRDIQAQVAEMEASQETQAIFGGADEVNMPAKKKQKKDNGNAKTPPAPPQPAPIATPTPHTPTHVENTSVSAIAATHTPMVVDADATGTAVPSPPAPLTAPAPAPLPVGLASKLSDLDRLEKRMVNKEQSLAQMESELIELQSRIAKKQTKMVELKQRVATLKEEIRAADTNANQTNDQTSVPTTTDHQPNDATNRPPPIAEATPDTNDDAPPMPNEAGAAPQPALSVDSTPAPMMVDDNTEPTIADTRASPAANTDALVMPNDADSIPPPAPSAASLADPSPSPSPSSVAPFIVRPGRPEDAADLSIFARQIFCDTFGEQNTAEDMDAYLKGAFSTEIQLGELTNPDLQVFIAQRDGAIIGYAMTRIGSAEPCVADPTALEIQRIYGKGVGAALMRRCLAHALWLGRDHTWLGVWEHNHRAVRFYHRYGFVNCGTHEFLLGQDPQIDTIMQRRHTVEVEVEGQVAHQLLPSTYIPLDSAKPLTDRVLHALEYGPEYELEKQFGLSTLQVAALIHTPIEQIEATIKTLQDEQRVKLAPDHRVAQSVLPGEQHYLIA